MKSLSKLFVFTLLCIPIFGFSQAGFITNADKTCKMYTASNVEKRTFSLVSGTCSGGYVSGQASVKVYQDGNWYVTYTGTFIRGMLNGQGTGTFSNGHKFSGTFVDGARSKGKYTHDDGRVYEGPFNAEGKKEGNGTQTYPSGNKYKGPFRNDMPSGNGIFYMPNGDRVEAYFEDLDPQGAGNYYFASGDRFEGILNKSGLSFSCAEGTLYRTSGSSMSGSLESGVFREKVKYVAPPAPPKPVQRATSEILSDLRYAVESTEIYDIITISAEYKSRATNIQLSKGGSSLVYTVNYVDAASGERYLKRFILDLSKVTYVYSYTNDNFVQIGAEENCMQIFEDNMTNGITNFFVKETDALVIYTRDQEEIKVANLLCELMQIYNSSVTCL